MVVSSLLWLVACGPKPAAAPPVAVDPPTPESITRRPFAPMVDGEAVIAGISYGPFREGQRPGGPDPTAEQILEDLRIIAPRWGMIRVYSSRGPTETILKTIHDEGLPIRVMVGAWIAPEAEADNQAEVKQAIRLANAYPEVVAAVSVGNESQVDWSGHRTPMNVLLRHLRAVRQAIEQPVTTADDYNFWNKPRSHDVADEVDFLVVHAYAMWNKQQLADAVPWTAEAVVSIAAEHPGLSLVIGETGWATVLNPDAGGDQVVQIVAPAGEAEQATFFQQFTAWAEQAQQPYFYFEAFDEPWKGGDNPRDVEKHWGLYNVDRTPKPALQASEATPQP
ncbi:MAG: hypothetical protein KTR31_20975 [Myxococcales bacterium]|nr:hypothetical protein [Myxococcales bacterium]